MKAMLLRGPKLPFEPVELPDPVPGPGEAVARVITCGSGLTIQHVKAGGRAIPVSRGIGHEITRGNLAGGPGGAGPPAGAPGPAPFLFHPGALSPCAPP